MKHPVLYNNVTDLNKDLESNYLNHSRLT